MPITITFFSKTACWLCVLLIMLPLLIGGCAVREDYFVGYIEDTSYADIKQYTWHVVVNKPFTTEQLQELAIKLVEDAKQQEEFHVLSIMFYDYEEYIGHGYTLGAAYYAPEGDMRMADSVMAGDYDSMSFEWILFEKDWDTMLSAEELEVWVAWIDAFYEELTPDYIPNRGDIMVKTAEALNLEPDEVDRIVNKQAMWSMQDLQRRDYGAEWETEPVSPVDSIKEYLELGMKKEQILDSFGHNYTVVINQKNDNEVWRYDFAEDISYQFVTELSEVDLAGLTSGILLGQLFLFWSEEETIQGFSLLYFNDADGKVYDYAVFPHPKDPESIITKEEPIT